MLVVLASCVMLVALLFLFGPRSVLSQQNGGTVITGWAWSDTVGWIDLNCANTNSCGVHNFGLAVAQNGDISGYTWSDNIGWISANNSDLSGCPSGACKAKLSGNNLQGWMRALSADGNSWDGWISLSGSGYGPTVSSGNFSGYAWGSDVVGWVDWSRAHTTFGQCAVSYSCFGQVIQQTDTSCNVTNVTTCTAPAFCSAGSSVCLYPEVQYAPSGHLTVQPAIVPMGFSSHVRWNVTNVTGCTVTGTNGDTWTIAGSAGNGWTSASPSGGETTSNIMAQTTYTLTCTGLDGTHPESESATVNVLPIFQEV
ncbi:hypothetical protein A2764_01865 [Candidatus Kaiserbacteria bacterium RIFCSPHIGHO2_01_FULL_55_79]|nr:MAG: hypothetical protein A2764_01865 [Candidatus Kaiserbacteria bacterium RIFCSPHIGHO2_01_FULL_55_79]OGG78102.1 MAG: hypothetical protein A3F56_03605 [Candidatus Kaiserbacteria bacterium RIFCSPHIGHO2_12_FULL_55_13]OGG83932.1 MAG: hypothetical protein A3A42_00345 [Candidatus Kaiserbacteria bacterium RIFCSPLOWO2_01_FULL_55_25]